MAYFTHLFLVGQPLESIEVSRQSYLPVLEQFKQEHCIGYSKIWLRVTGEFVGVPAFDDPDAAEADVLSRFETSHNHQCLFAFHLAKLIACYAFGHHTQAVEHGLHALESQEAAFGVLLTSAHTFYYSLALLASLTSLTPVEWETELEKVFENQTKLQHLADHAPGNYQHKCELVAAEIHRVQGQHSGAIALYDCAIAGAKTNGYIQEAALANELAARFYLNWGKEKVAAGYMKEAYYSYAQWGAKAKVEDLVNRYPRLLAPILQQQRIALSATETLFSPIFIAASQTNIQVSTSSSTSISAHLDLATVLKASQTLSSEIQLDKLLANLMTIVVEAAGADKAALILRHSQTLEVGVTYFDGKVHDTDPLPLSQTTHLPISVVQSVNRTEKLVILNSVSRDYFAHDPYLKTYQPASVLAAPIFSRGAVIAILYVENSLTARAFTSDRIELLNTICVQAAISLENARLYQQSQAYVQQLEQSQLQVVQSEKMASLGNLVAGVAHEINNPIGFLNGSIKNAKDYVQDLFSHLALYQQHYPDPIALIQDDAEDIDLEFLNEDLPHLLDTMKGATDRIKGISTSLRTFSRADTEYKVKANLNEGIDSTILILKYRLKANECRPAIKVIQDYGDLPEIDCFPGQLNQVFMNILANAIDMFDDMAQQIAFAELQAHPQTITIQTRLTSQDSIEIRLRDNGRGMSAALKSRIFDPLFTTKAVGKGTGLGLAIARQIVVEKHGGNLEVRSELEQGTEFCIRLPMISRSAYPC